MKKETICIICNDILVTLFSSFKEKKLWIVPITLLQVVIGLGVIFLIPMYAIDYIYIGNRITINTNFILVLSYVVLLLESFLFFWIKGVALIGANRAGIYLHLMPILAAILAMIIFDEVLYFIIISVEYLLFQDITFKQKNA